MTRTHFVALAAALVLGHAVTASAQNVQSDFRAPAQERIAVDPMDPLGLLSARRLVQIGVPSSMIVTTTPSLETSSDYIAYQNQYDQYLARYAVYAADTNRKSDGPSRWTTAVTNISTGMQLGHEALNLYEHGLDANALRNSYKGN